MAYKYLLSAGLVFTAAQAVAQPATDENRIMLLINDYSKNTWSMRESEIARLNTIRFQLMEEPRKYFNAIATLEIAQFPMYGQLFSPDATLRSVRGTPESPAPPIC